MAAIAKKKPPVGTNPHKGLFHGYSLNIANQCLMSIEVVWIKNKAINFFDKK